MDVLPCPCPSPRLSPRPFLPGHQAALTDSEAGVRAAAGDAFAILFKGGSGSAVDSVVPSMISGVGNGRNYVHQKGPALEMWMCGTCHRVPYHESG